MSSPAEGETPLTAAPGTPTERHTRFDTDETPIQSPMLRITEEDHDDDADLTDSPQRLAPPGIASKRQSTYGGSLYALDNNSSSSLFIPGGNVAGNRSSVTSLKYTPQMQPPMRGKSPVRSASPQRSRSSSPRKPGPFNFKSTNLSTAPLGQNPRASHRKGHRYKHSSVSMNLFQEPKQRAPLRITVSYPIPTLKEFLSSCTHQQKLMMSWAGFHLLCSLLTFFTGFIYSLHSFSTLSHLIFYDALACIIAVLTDVMDNFDVYTKSSIKFPFGLGRIQVLFAFALSVSLIFVGCDLGSHFIEELIMGFFSDDGHDHSGHNQHKTGSISRISVPLYESIILLTIGVTFVSSRITASLTKESSLKSIVMNNPTHVITLVFSIYLAVNPLLLNIQSSVGIDEIAALTISCLIIVMGSQVVKYLGYIVLLSFPNIDTKTENFSSQLTGEIRGLGTFRSTYSIENLIISKVHMGLVVVLINIKMIGGADDAETLLRTQVDGVIRRVLPSEKVETTIDINRF